MFWSDSYFFLSSDMFFFSSAVWMLHLSHSMLTYSSQTLHLAKDLWSPPFSIFLLLSTTLKHFACLNWVSFHSVPSLTYFFIVCNLVAYKYLHLNSWVLVSLASLALYQKLCNGCSLSLAHISIICIRSSILRNWSVPSMHISILNALGKFVEWLLCCSHALQTSHEPIIL